MRSAEILECIKEAGLQCQNWTRNEIKDWVKANYYASNYVASKVADEVYYNSSYYTT